MLSWYPAIPVHAVPGLWRSRPSDEADEHRCERYRYVEYQLLLLRPQIAAFELQFRDWLYTPQGRFAAFYAARQRLAVAA